MTFEIKPARRMGTIPLLALNGKSGSGKTKSALLLMRGLVGEKGRIVCIDTENGRALHFAGTDDKQTGSEIPGGFEHLSLDPPFSAERYLEAIRAAEKVADGIVIDSLSHEWNGEGGALDQFERFLDQKAGDDYRKREALKMLAWNNVGSKHTLLVNALMRTKVPILCCFRAKDKIILEKKANEQGREKTTVEKDFDAPIQRADMIHEMLMALTMTEREGVGGFFAIRKPGPASLRTAFEAVKGEQLGIEHGRAIAEWCCRGLIGAPASAPKAATTGATKERRTLFKEIWAATRGVHDIAPEFDNDKDAKAEGLKRLEQHLWDEGIIGEQEVFLDLTAERLEQVKARVTVTR